MRLEQLHVFYQGNQGMRLDRVVQFVSDKRSTCRAMYSLILIFLACVIFIHGWNKQFLDHSFIKIIFPHSGILYFVMNYRIKGTIKL